MSAYRDLRGPRASCPLCGYYDGHGGMYLNMTLIVQHMFTVDKGVTNWNTGRDKEMSTQVIINILYPMLSGICRILARRIQYETCFKPAGIGTRQKWSSAVSESVNGGPQSLAFAFKGPMLTR